MKVLIVEDEHRIATALQKGLKQERFAVDVAYDGASGYDLASVETYDVIVLDLMLPKMDGISVCKKLREGGNHTPILMLTAKNQVRDRVSGLDAGADDYLSKPFAFEELLARVRALTRRPQKMTETTLKVSDLTLDPKSFEVTRAGKSVQLSSKEFALLEYFMRNPNTILSKEQLISHVWNYDADILPNTVEVYVKKLREKIDVPFADKEPLLHTIRGFGYKLGV